MFYLFLSLCGYSRHGINISFSVGPAAVRLLGVKQSLSAGQPHEVVCEAVGARPAPTLSWWRGEQKIIKAISKPQVNIIP